MAAVEAWWTVAAIAHTRQPGRAIFVVANLVPSVIKSYSGSL